MGNSWFQFKQFRVEQALAPLKVGTDACILGAWSQHESPRSILDIGTGTGLLSLMLAQRYEASIDALEPNAQAAGQAAVNFCNSPWKDRIKLQQLLLQEYFPAHTYDFIVCNPPFYASHLKSGNRSRDMALHQESLSFTALAQHSSRLLAASGRLFVLLPPRQAQEFELEAKQAGLYVQQRLHINDRPSLPVVHRTVFSFGKKVPEAEQVFQLTIRDASGAYSDQFRDLMKEYYLIF
ncbi:tRNA1(Val) (adenine(37)-N6)-methyltransferase [Cesiribacter sp. SM1]|uniref:tRNA1(Val) (adenine(37)-N6)-methyltransferase n=1 Tax=Cesiribacter sp. SM1 TaxID=2861196 RepID=UPI001CD34F05|nr:methyltransferase [Cesiribacter sp. SM1]